MAANAVGPVARHEAHDQSADDGDKNHRQGRPAGGMRRRRNQLAGDRQAVIVEEICEQADQPLQCESHEGAEAPRSGWLMR